MNEAMVASIGVRQILERRTGWFGAAMVAVIMLNAGLSLALGGIPESWGGGARTEVAQFLNDPTSLDRSAVLFAFSTLIFVFGIGFFAGLRQLAETFDPSGWTKGVITIGAALFLAGGLVSETLHTGTAVALHSTPSYSLDANDVLLLRSLWPTALAQGQVGLGVVVVALSMSARRAQGLPGWLVVLGLVAGTLAIIRPALVGNVPMFIVLFAPMFIWIIAISVVLLRHGASRRERREEFRS
jgi:hypothetical protein